jgi:hypothetical protein
LKKKSGNSSDINLSLYSLLNEANISVFPVLLSTRSNGRHPGFPMLTKFDNLVLLVKVGENQYLLDATDKNLSIGMIAHENLNHEGYLVDFSTETGQWTPLECTAPSKKTVALNLTMDASNKLTGNMYISCTNYEALRSRIKYQNATNQTDYLKSFKTDKPGLGINNYKISNLLQPDQVLTESMDVVIEDNIEEAGNLAYFTPLLFERTKENPFKIEERKYPVDFAYPSEEHYRITITLPQGYQMDKLPKSEKFILPGETASFTFLFAAEENRISLYSKIITKKSVYTAEEYHDLKALFKSVVAKQAEQIVLKKI